MATLNDVKSAVMGIINAQDNSIKDMEIKEMEVSYQEGKLDIKVIPKASVQELQIKFKVTKE